MDSDRFRESTTSYKEGPSATSIGEEAAVSSSSFNYPKAPMMSTLQNPAVESSASSSPGAPSGGDNNNPGLPNPEHPTLHLSHTGEHHGDYGDQAVSITRNTYIFAACAALNSCNLGFDIGVTTGAGPLIQETEGLTDTQLEIFMGSINLFAMIGGLGSYLISDRFGRRGSFIVAAIGFIFGVIIMASSHQYSVLMVGRFFVGLGVGFGLAIDPIYIAEISPAKFRGQLVTWSEICINLGIVLGFASGLFFEGLEDNIAWRVMIAVGMIMPLVLIFLVIKVMPESPRWLVSKGRSDEARGILQLVYPEGFNVEPVLEDIQISLQRDAEAEGAVGWGMIFFPTPAFRRMLFVGIGTAVAQQIVGVDAIQYFLDFILEEMGVSSRTARGLALILLGLIKLAFIVLASRLLDTKGRRPLLFISLGGMTFALLVLAINFLGSSSSAAVGITALAIYLASFSMGMGPGAWLVASEVFSTSIRAKAMSVATCLNRLAATLMSSTFLTDAKHLTYSGFFFLLAVICAAVGAIMYVWLPETKGHSLEDMAMYFAEITGDQSILEFEQKLAQDRGPVVEMSNNASAAAGASSNEPPPVTGSLA